MEIQNSSSLKILYIQRVNAILISFDVPVPHTHAWENSTEICKENTNCISVDYCFREENESFDFLDCNIKGNPLLELVAKPPNNYGKSVK